MANEYTLTTSHTDAWRRALPTEVNVWGGIEYAQIVQTHLGYDARLFVVEHNDTVVVYPFWVRPIDTHLRHQHAAPLHDALTPEFTGPIVRHTQSVHDTTHFAARFARYCQEQGIVTEFARLHPWNVNTQVLDPAAYEANREIVYVDLTWPEARLWQHAFNQACRKNIRRAQQEQVRVFEAQTIDDVREFHRIYIHTMQRNAASSSYCYPLDYFVAFWKHMPQYARFTLAEYRGRVVAGTLYLHDDDDVYSYLGGADQAFQHVRPTNAIVYDTIQWAQQQGKRRLVLGGGYKPDDGIFRFKASFSPLRTPFNVYKRVHLADAYQALCIAWSAQHDRPVTSTTYFPPYRDVVDA